MRKYFKINERQINSFWWDNMIKTTLQLHTLLIKPTTASNQFENRGLPNLLTRLWLKSQIKEETYSIPQLLLSKKALSVMKSQYLQL